MKNLEIFLYYIPENQETIKEIIKTIGLPQIGEIYKDRGHTMDSGETWEYNRIEYDADTIEIDINIEEFEKNPQVYENEDLLCNIIMHLFNYNQNYGVVCKNSFGENMFKQQSESFIFTNNKRVKFENGDFNFYELDKDFYDFAAEIIKNLALTLYHGFGEIPLTYTYVYEEIDIDLKNKKINWNNKFKNKNFDEKIKTEAKKIKNSVYKKRFLDDLRNSYEMGGFFCELIEFVISNFDLKKLNYEEKIKKEFKIKNYLIGKKIIFQEKKLREPMSKEEIMDNLNNASFLEKDAIFELIKEGKSFYSLEEKIFSEKEKEEIKKIREQKKIEKIQNEINNKI